MTGAAPAAFLLDRRGGVLWLTLNRPDHGNAVASETVPLLTEALRQARADTWVRCLVIGGAGKHFCSGGDVAAFARDVERAAPERQRDFARRLNALATLIEAVMAFDRPIIAAVHGAVAGAGLMFALGADLVVGDETSLFLFSHQRVGLSPDGAVSYLLPRIVGPRAASRLVLTAARVPAEEAASLGLLTELATAGDLAARVAALAAQMASAPAPAVRHAKALLRRSETSSLAGQLAAEGSSIEALVAEPDFNEGVRAFMEKRAPAFPSCQDMG